VRFFENLKLQKWTLVIIVVLLNFNTLRNQYALDDAIVITKNQHVEKGLSGIPDILKNDTFQGFFGSQQDLVAGGRYRPLSLITFAIEYQFFGLNPMVGHFINIVIYAIIVVLLLLVLRELIPNANNQWLKIAWLTTFLFAIHPIHTEAVANIKGRDELMTLLFALLAWLSVFKWIKTDKTKHLILASLYIFLGSMSKEHAVAFVFVIPFSLWFFNHAKLNKSIIAAVPLFVGALAFVIIRQNVLGSFSFDPGDELMNNPFANATIGQKYATILFTFVWYLKLLFVPHPLTFDYYPYHVRLVEPTSLIAIFSLLVFIVMIFIALYGLKRRYYASFWIIFFFATFVLMSNLLFTVGTFMNERFMFIPSISFAFGLAWFLSWLLQKNKKIAISGLILITALTSFKVYSRNKVWYDDATLFSTDVKTSSNSAKSNTTMGGMLFEKAQKEKDKEKQHDILVDADKYLSKALEIHPNYNDARLLKGNVVFQLQSPDSAMRWYFDIFKKSPRHGHAWKNALIVVESISDIDNRIDTYTKLYSIDSNRFEITYNLGLLYSKNKSDYTQGTLFLEKAVKSNPNNKNAIRDLGITYGMQGNYEKSEVLLSDAVKRFPDDGQLFYNLAITLYNLKKYDEAQKAFDRASDLDSSIKPVKLVQ